MEGYVGHIIILGVVVTLGVLFYAWSTGMFNGFSSSVSKNANGVVGGTISFDIVSPPAGQSYTFASGKTNDSNSNNIYYAKITVEVTGDGNKLNGQYITVGTNTKGYYVIGDDPTKKNLTDIQAQPYFKTKIDDTSGDYTYDVYVVSDHNIATAGEQVTLQIKIGSTIKTVQIYAYPSS